MKKQVLTTFFVLMILSLSVSAGWFDWVTGNVIQSTCTDSDNGAYLDSSPWRTDIYTKGSASDSYGQKVMDECIIRSTGGGTTECSGDDCALEEAICDSNTGTPQANTYSPNGTGIPCPNGCKDGACLKEAIVGKPDFSVTYLAVSNSNPKINDIIQVKFTILNKGSPFYKSSTQFGGVDYTLTRSDSNLKGTMASGWINKDLLTGQEETLSFDAQILDKQTTFEVIVDSGLYVAETYETNNKRSLVVNAQAEQPTTTQGVCTDSDGGKDYYKKGTTKDQYTGSTTDYCIYHPENFGQKWEISEYWCDNANDGRGLVKFGGGHYCLEGETCNDGACLEEASATQPITQEISCTDSDGGENYYVKGRTKVVGGLATEDDFCTDSVLTEFICIGNAMNPKQFACPNGCSDGACVKETQPQQNVNCGVNTFKVNTECTETEKGFRHAYFGCYDGVESYQGDETSCKDSRTWERYGAEFCKGHCEDKKPESPTQCPSDKEIIAQIDKCKELGVDYIKKTNDKGCIVTECIRNQESGSETKAPECSGCLVNKTCLPIGTRKSGQFCSVDSKFIRLKVDNTFCQNSFECSSNLCIDGSCVPGSVWQKFLVFLSNIFG